MTKLNEEGNKVINISLFGDRKLIGKIISRFAQYGPGCEGINPNDDSVFTTINEKRYLIYMENSVQKKNPSKFELKTKNPDAIFFAYDTNDEGDTFKILKSIPIEKTKKDYSNAFIAIVVNNKNGTKQKEDIEKEFNEFYHGENVFFYEIDIDKYEQVGSFFMDMIYKILKIEKKSIVKEELPGNEPDNLSAPKNAFAGKKVKEKKCFLRECCDSCLLF